MSTSVRSRGHHSIRPSVGTVLYVYTTLDSTNAQAAKLLTEIRPKHGTIVLAGDQTAGRGQIGRTWHSSPGENLCASVILYPDIGPKDQFVLNMGICLAVRDTVLEFSQGKPVCVKWPNDVYVGDRKIAGILIQNTIQGNVITATIAGIGLNVSENAFPEDLPNPTSLRRECATETTSTPDLHVVLASLISHLNTRLDQITRSESAALIKAYHNALYRKDMLSAFFLPDRSEQRPGRITHVDDHGKLVIVWEDGKTEAFGFREIEFIL